MPCGFFYFSCSGVNSVFRPLSLTHASSVLLHCISSFLTLVVRIILTLSFLPAIYVHISTPSLLMLPLLLPFIYPCANASIRLDLTSRQHWCYHRCHPDLSVSLFSSLFIVVITISITCLCHQEYDFWRKVPSRFHIPPLSCEFALFLSILSSCSDYRPNSLVLRRLYLLLAVLLISSRLFTVRYLSFFLICCSYLQYINFPRSDLIFDFPHFSSFKVRSTLSVLSLYHMFRLASIISYLVVVECSPVPSSISSICRDSSSVWIMILLHPTYCGRSIHLLFYSWSSCYRRLVVDPTVSILFCPNSCQIVLNVFPHLRLTWIHHQNSIYFLIHSVWLLR